MEDYNEEDYNEDPRQDWPFKQKKKPEPPKGEKSIGSEILSFVLYILAVIVLTYLIIHFVGQRTEVSGQSMEDTLHNKDNLIVDKLSYRIGNPKRFDIVVFPHGDQYFIKRIIGLPGETVHVDEQGKIYINGQVLEENYGKEVIKEETRLTAAGKIVLKDDEYFVMGDNRNHSRDSRDPTVGPVAKDKLIGKVWIRIWPISQFGFVKHQ
ncbi:signal peptidase I [Clostridia bacterium]|nr:signal peptidase I [Clostridia bacterium]